MQGRTAYNYSNLCHPLICKCSIEICRYKDSSYKYLEENHALQ